MAHYLYWYISYIDILNTYIPGAGISRPLLDSRTSSTALLGDACSIYDHNIKHIMDMLYFVRQDQELHEHGFFFYRGSSEVLGMRSRTGICRFPVYIPVINGLTRYNTGMLPGNIPGTAFVLVGSQTAVRGLGHYCAFQRLTCLPSGQISDSYLLRLDKVRFYTLALTRFQCILVW